MRSNDGADACLQALTPGVLMLFGAAGGRSPELGEPPWRQPLFDAELVRWCAQVLPERERVVLHLRWGFAGARLSVEEVASFCEVPPSVVRTREQNALHRLRSSYSALLG